MARPCSAHAAQLDSVAPRALRCASRLRRTEDQAAESFTVFTTRPDTLYGATFIVVAADAAFAEQIVAPEHKAALEQYREDIKALSDIDRQSSDREKTGVFTGRDAD